MADQKTIATAEELTLIAEYERVNLPNGELTFNQTIHLPESGRDVVLRRPTTRWWTRRYKRLPQNLASFVEFGEKGPPDSAISREDLLSWSFMVVALVTDIFVDPKVSLTPAEGELSPDCILDDDLIYLWHWASGIKGGGGPDLESFRTGRVGDAANDGVDVGTATL